MSGLAFLIPIALGLGMLGLAAFFWAMKRGQFEDLDGAAQRIQLLVRAEAGRERKRAIVACRGFGRRLVLFITRRDQR